MSSYTGLVAAILAGDEILDSDLATWHDLLAAIIGTETSYTPTVTGVTLGSGGSVFGAFSQIGKTCFFRAGFILGTSGVLTGNPTISLPVQAANGLWTAQAYLHDASATSGVGRQPAAINPSALTSFTMWSASGSLSAISPFTWTVNDQAYVTGHYPTV